MPTQLALRKRVQKANGMTRRARREGTKSVIRNKRKGLRSR